MADEVSSADEDDEWGDARHDVFISYSHQDKTAADAICGLLERDGIRCWIAPRDVQPGVAWATSVIRGINGARVFVLLFSNFANTSPQVSREVERAANRQLPILPFRIEDVAPNETLEFFISSPHWMDALTPPLEAHIEHLSAAVRRLLNSGGASPRATGQVGATAKERPAATDIPAPSTPETEPSAQSPPTTAPDPEHAGGLDVRPPPPAEPAPDELPARSMDSVRPPPADTAAAGADLRPDAVASPERPQPPPMVQPAVAPRQGPRVRPLLLAAGVLAFVALVAVLIFHLGNPKTIAVPGTVNSVAFSPDGQRIVSGLADDTVRVWDATTDQEIGAPFTGHTYQVNSVAFSPDGRRIVSGSDDETVRIWDASSGQEIGQPFTGHTAQVRAVAFSPDGQRVVSSSDDKTLRIWDASTGQEIGAPLTGHTEWVGSVAFSPDGRRIVSGSKDGTVRIWDASTGQEIGAPINLNSAVYSVAFSPDGRWIASGTDDKMITVWDASTGREIGSPCLGHTDLVWSVAFSADSERIVSGSPDKTIRIWDASTGQEIGAPLRGHSGAVWSAVFSPDGRRIVSGSSDDTIRIWRVPDAFP